ncbi:MvaI/BcnI family restriction endonuclease [Defluviimonas salinarum]|uniref:MvaI/BcnI family restriction endonuclease n=1 Tax=Defluviimonas salinarum TaxID=2992147 RepID=A0ABT3J983_9RHOB|nr:MvaI/BcnI family restriction endonuclease [Defluviimonas salinarum]MCW3784226.1 MvaI/BcnI family restriction endonuclease [Defluviimonas salinarum]
MAFEYNFHSLSELAALLGANEATEALIKPLSKNHNDKNQVYSGSDFRPLYPMFDMTFSLRGPSVSGKKGGATTGQSIPEAVFTDFSWLDLAGHRIAARGVRMIIYPQYPETRLSAFQTVENTMPEAMSVAYTKTFPDSVRYLVLARRGNGAVLAVMVVDPGPQFVSDVQALPPASGSRVWKHLRLRVTADSRLQTKLARVAGKPMPGCRLDSAGNTLPFNGTQVCGYTLEHALGINPNSDSHGDFEGIELKTHTQKKVTLFTPEPDMGVYAESFPEFMQSFGYQDKEGNWRVTGIHRVDERCEQSGLTLRIANHERGTSLASSADKNVHLALLTDEGILTAGWSLERILNCWTAKHNEAVYVPAVKVTATDLALIAEGYRFSVEFSSEIMWCRETSAERLFEALYNGTLFLDPAPKFCPGKPQLNKRRSQWRVNDIRAAARDIYTDVRIINLQP